MKGKSLISSALQLISVILIMWAMISLSDHVIMLFLGVLLCGMAWLLFDTLEAKGKFKKIDQKIYDTKLSAFLRNHRTAVYTILFAIGLLLTLFVYSIN